MRKIFLIGILAIVAFPGMGYALNDATIVAEGPAIAGTPDAYYSRPDVRMCAPFPQCGGAYLFEPPLFGDPCLDELTLVQYVTGIFVREDDGTLTRIFPDCNQALTGSIEPDPEHPGFDIFVYLPYVS